MRPSRAIKSSDSEPDSAEIAPFPVATTVDAGTGANASLINPRSSRRGPKGLARPIPLGVVLVLAILLTVAAGFLFYSAGSRAGFQQAESAALKEDVELTPEFLARLDAALVALQDGNGTVALAELRALEKEEPEVATLSLLLANAALIADKPDEAGEAISESIRKRESVSDALTLRAILEAKLATDSDYKKMGSPKVRIEQLLRQAIAADSSNARPYYELATLKRFENKYDEAAELLRSAQSRMNAADSRIVMDTALELTLLQMKPDADLKPVENPRPAPWDLFPAAYVSMRLGDFPKAAQQLSSVEAILPASLFRQILKDPAFQPFAKEAALAGFFKSTGQSSKK